MVFRNVSQRVTTFRHLTEQFMTMNGRTIALAEGRQLEDLVQMLEKEGATTLRCPMLSILDNPEEGPVLSWMDELIAGSFQLVILMTGEGLRRLLSLATRHGKREPLLAALAKVRTLTRGPKPVRALKEVGLTPGVVAEVPTTDGVIATLKRESLKGQTVGLQLAAVPNPAVVAAIETGGGQARTVLPYVYAAGADSEKVAELIARLDKGEVAAICFTSAPQVDRLYEVAGERGLLTALQSGLGKTKVAAVGPVVADNLQARGRPADICPEQGFQMKNLVLHIKRALV
jgi:uroporphyrinogen-III synthase